MRRSHRGFVGFRGKKIPDYQEESKGHLFTAAMKSESPSC